MNTKVLMVSMLYDYGIKERGFSYDYYNIYDVLKRVLGENALFFDYKNVFDKQEKYLLNEQLLRTIKKEKPELTIFSLYTNQFIPEVLDQIREHTKTLCYFWDDQWRIKFSTYWAPHFDYITTPDFNGIRKWRERGLEKVIYSPFGCNHYLWAKNDFPKKYDVSFAGAYHPYREWILKKLRKAGINVYIGGAGGKNGYISFDELINVLNQSKINLNLSNSGSLDIRYMLSSAKAFRNAMSRFKKGDVKNREQIKGRHFEIPGCGGFQLSYYVEGLEHCYEVGKEITIYMDMDDLIEKIRYYLKNESERGEIAQNGYKRTLSEHTYEKRIKEIFNLTGIKYGK
ncbi:MAG: glycosyltransferase [Candidatus Omnitrophica bacterium]|nr:glycosyltransferase [Candidatus Omnitrophota bacterium]